MFSEGNTDQKTSSPCFKNDFLVVYTGGNPLGLLCQVELQPPTYLSKPDQEHWDAPPQQVLGYLKGDE